ncbi:unnamed protein product [Penicillium olsonii]|uniref:SWIM-type domain-containing protein n=1 Tax=Penicillium olsonii TaxID=99116 RepID=A0A9W4IBR7_PENOL|nr:unnamed protein product [Penicillium olsonii]CAG8173616.1 unnamed protein product [Penicillium olsonii]CAG8271794.1 unnamed protein product [Penicillium olsonii]
MDFIDRLILELPSDIKPLMLTLHCLFPNDFLPALDLLDRKLVRSVHFGITELFLVASTASQESYEVRLHAWNCSCASFTLAAYRSQPAETTPSPEQVPYRFGGISQTAQMAPVCKHILACVLYARCPTLVGDDTGSIAISREELAGWCAGWGG